MAVLMQLLLDLSVLPLSVLFRMSDFAHGLSVYKSKQEEQQQSDGLSSGGLNVRTLIV